MKTSDRSLLLVVPLVAAVLAFWFLVLSPKRDEANKLGDQITKLERSVADQKEAADQGLVARKSFPSDYHRLVVMGKSVPADDDTASLLVEVNRIAQGTGVDFRAIQLTDDATAPTGTTVAPPAPGAPTATAPPPEPEAGTEGESSTTTASTTAAAPTEAAAAVLPIGATVGSAGLPVLPYNLTFRGTFFEIADFMAAIDRMVDTGRATIASDGRLVTIDGFSLSADQDHPFPNLKVQLLVKTYITPSAQGLTAGATPAGPAPAVPAQPTATPTSTAPSTGTGTATSVTP
jgi:Tfp pilus assembly protein PilO